MSTQIQYLNRFSPAEIELLLKGNKVDQRDLLKYTLFDLILKKVLAVEEVVKRASSKDPEREYKYIIIGPNFKSHLRQSHELAFLDPFDLNNEDKILVQQFSKMVYWDGEDEDEYIEKIISKATISHFFSKRIWQYMFGGFVLSSRGKELKREIEKEIKFLETELSAFLLARDIRSENIVKPIAGNLAHLKNLDPKLKKIVNNPFLIEFGAYLSIDYSRNDETDTSFYLKY